MNQNPQTLLVPVDFSDAMPEVLKTAATLARAFGSRVVLLHVVEPEPDFVGFEPGPVSIRGLVAKEFQSDRKDLAEAREVLAKSGVEVTALQIQGDIVEKIIQESVSQNAGMIVLGSHGHGALHHLLTGSVAAGVLKAARCPVLVVPAKKP